MDYTQQEHPPEQSAPASRDRTGQHRMREDLKAYQDGELSPLRRWWVGRHVEQCASCQAEITGLQRLTRDMQDLERAMPRPQLRARILASLPDAPPVQYAASSRPVNACPAFGTARRPMLAMGSACAVLLLMVGVLALNHWQHTVTPAGNGAVKSVVLPPSVGLSAPDTITANADSAGQSAAQPADSAHPPLDPFSPARSAGTRSDTPLTASRIALDTTGTHLSRQSSSAPSVIVSSANGEAYTDPTSRVAEELASRALPEKLVTERHNTAAPVLQSVHLVQQAKDKNGKAEPIQMALAVLDVSEARRQVQMWAEQTGATVTAVVSRPAGVGSAVSEGSGSAVTPSGETARPDHATVAPTPTLLKIQVTAQRAELFKSRLNDMGMPLIPAGKTFHATPRIAMIQERNDDTVSAPALRGGTGAQAEQKATVTILLRLQPGSQLPH